MPEHPLCSFQEGAILSRGASSNQYVEKTFLTLLALSLLLHIAGFVLLYLWPAAKPPQLTEPTFIDLQDMPELKTAQPRPEPDKVRPSDQRRRVIRETSPRQEQPAARTDVPPRPAATSRQERPSPVEPGGSSTGDLLRRRQPQPQPARPQPGTAPDMARLLPSASRMAQLEESYRRKFADDVADGDTRFLNSNDVMFGSFLRRFETAVYGVWRYPQEAALKGIEGVTPVKITFNRNGEVVNIKLLESSGSRLLDDEVFRTLRLVGPMGNLPKGYPKEEFHLIAFFQYGNARSRLR